MINACAKSGQWQMAVDMLNKFEKFNGGPPVRSRTKPGPSVNCPSLVCYNSAISACDRGGQWQLALEILERTGPMANIVTHNAAISACAEQGRWQEALEILARLRRRGIFPTYKRTATQLADLLRFKKVLVLLSPHNCPDRDSCVETVKQALFESNMSVTPITRRAAQTILL